VARDEDADYVLFSYIGCEYPGDPRDLITTLALFPDVIWQVRGRLQDGNYVRLSIESAGLREEELGME
jgi:hypothetical protein